MKKKYSLFIGRWQPFHKGHRKLINTILNEGKNVCIAIRDTEITKNNPYSLLQRMLMLEKEFKKQKISGRVKVITIPDIEEVVYGRTPGWKIRQIKLGKQTEAISGTKIRDNLHKNNLI